jgi:hypothetical protein
VTRFLLRLLLALLVLAVLMVGADRGAAFLAARAVSLRLQHSLKTATAPGITFAGVPFLTQAVQGRYQQVHVALSDVPSNNGLVVGRIDATLDGVHAPLNQVLSADVTSLPVDRAEATALVTFGALEASANARLSGQGVRVTLRRTSASTVGATASLTTALGALTVSGQLRLSVSGGRVQVTLDSTSLVGIPPVLRDLAARQIGGSVVAPALPFQLSIRSVTITDAGLQLTATGSDFTIR